MKILWIALILLFFAWLGSGCVSPDTAPLSPVVDEHTSRLALDWSGTYAGVLPCADCAGIDTRLRLDADQTYVLETRYLGKADEVFARRGVFVWQPDGNRIRLQGLEEDAALYQVGENQLFHLDRRGQRIRGNLADAYVLRKLDD